MDNYNDIFKEWQNSIQQGYLASPLARTDSRGAIPSIQNQYKGSWEQFQMPSQRLGFSKERDLSILESSIPELERRKQLTGADKISMGGQVMLKSARYDMDINFLKDYQNRLLGGSSQSTQSTSETQKSSGGFDESVSNFDQNIQQFDQNMLDYEQRVLSFPRSRQFNPVGFIHTRKLTQ